MDTFDFEFLTHRPDPPLERFVESIWFARGTVPYRREKIAPTGSTVAVLVLGDPIMETPDDGAGQTLRAETGFILGPHDRPVINEPTGETFAVGVVTTPIGAEAVFGVEPSTIRGKAVDVNEVWSEASRLRSQLLELERPEEMLQLMASHLGAGHTGPISGIDRCERAVAMLEADPSMSIADIASALEISHSHLVREMTRIVGLTPRALARLLRMRRVLVSIDVRDDVDWSRLAINHGWFDQAHLIRDFKRHTGATPTQYLAAQRAVYSPVEAGDAAGFVPEP